MSNTCVAARDSRLWLYYLYLGAGLAGGQVIDPGQGGGEGGALAPGEVAEQLIRGGPAVGDPDKGARHQLEVVLGGQDVLVHNPNLKIESRLTRDNKAESFI